jgi:hypothetical protein
MRTKGCSRKDVKKYPVESSKSCTLFCRDSLFIYSFSSELPIFIGCCRENSKKLLQAVSRGSSFRSGSGQQPFSLGSSFRYVGIRRLCILISLVGPRRRRILIDWRSDGRAGLICMPHQTEKKILIGWRKKTRHAHWWAPDG